VRKVDNLTTPMCRMSGNLGDSTSWNPKGLFRPVQGFDWLHPDVLLIKFIELNTTGSRLAHQ
jgi:hypothetical protein